MLWGEGNMRGASWKDEGTLMVLWETLPFPSTVGSSYKIDRRGFTL